MYNKIYQGTQEQVMIEVILMRDLMKTSSRYVNQKKNLHTKQSVQK